MPAVHGPRAEYYDPRDGDRAVRVQSLHIEHGSREPPRTNYFAVYRVDSGSGTVAADDAHCPFGPGSLLFFVPYQYVRFAAAEAVRGEVIEFHANFLCVETFHAEVGCSGKLFNDPYGVPVLPLDERVLAEVTDLSARIRRELADRGLAHSEAVLAYLRLLLIVATREKTGEGAACRTATAHRHPVLAQLGELIEQNYRTWHSPALYADALYMTEKALGRVVRAHLGTTPTDLIRRRVLIHAKWQLLHTLRPVKEIARETGFSDELYFSRLFKKATGVSPIYFREFETTIRGGSNLSMFLVQSSIPTPAGEVDNSVISSDHVGGSDGIARDGARRRRGNRRAKSV
ncbi:MAG: helix-turn-helix transcriptional regulator [Pirellulales bacterium]